MTSTGQPSDTAAIEAIGALRVGELTNETVVPAPTVHEPWAPISAALSRAMDVTVALVTLTVLSPLLVAVAVAIRRDSGGPIIFRQERLGRRGQKFTLLKYRTMHAAADVEPHRQYVRALIGGQQNTQRGDLYKLTVDPRITRVGRRLRKWSLDELPQLVNVLRGDMALVGPRPVIPYEAELYPPSYLGRFAVKPGITGLWQVSGRNKCTYDEMVRLDVEYAERRSLWLDLTILIKTIPVVLRREGVA